MRFQASYFVLAVICFLINGIKCNLESTNCIKNTNLVCGDVSFLCCSHHARLLTDDKPKAGDCWILFPVYKRRLFECFDPENPDNLNTASTNRTTTSTNANCNCTKN